MQPLRVFHYISNAKVDDFYEQLPRGRWGRSVEAGVGIPGVAQGKVIVSKAPVELSLHKKLAKLEEHINWTEPPGAADWGTPYIRDRMMLWEAVIEAELDGEPDMALFAGRSRYGTSVVLGGSAAHLGMRPRDPMMITDSSFRQVRRAVDLGIQRWRNIGGNALVKDHAIDAGPGDQGPFIAVDRLFLDHICYIARIAPSSWEWVPVGYCEFLALVVCRPEPALSDDPDEDDLDDARSWPSGVLATPLYVQHLADREPKPTSSDG